MSEIQKVIYNQRVAHTKIVIIGFSDDEPKLFYRNELYIISQELFNFLAVISVIYHKYMHLKKFKSQNYKKGPLIELKFITVLEKLF